MSTWEDLPIDSRVFRNLDETALTRANAALENAYITESGAQKRFPGIKNFVTLLGDNAKVYLSDHRGDLLAVSESGRTYRVTRDAEVIEVTNVAVGGGKRPTFAKTPTEIVIAAGAQIIRLASDKTEILSDDAPISTHVGYIDGFLVAIEIGSERFFHTVVNDTRNWQPLDVFAAEGQPDNLTMLFVTEFRELLLGGPDSIEQFTPLPQGTTPFIRRFAQAGGVGEPYTTVQADNAVFLLNSDDEYVRVSGQASVTVSDDIQSSVEKLDDKSEAWAAHVIAEGQKFIILQFPNATNIHGTTGVTQLFDYREGRWSSLFGWDDILQTPTVWPGVSHHRHWSRNFIGGQGWIGELDSDIFTNRGDRQRMLSRSAHLEFDGQARMDNFRMLLKRGTGSNEVSPEIRIRFQKDNERWTEWVRRPLGRTGDRNLEIYFGSFGTARTFQLEYEVHDDADVLVRKAEGLMEKVGF